MPTCYKINIESLFNALYTKGETKLSDHATPVEKLEIEPTTIKISQESLDKFNSGEINHYERACRYAADRLDKSDIIEPEFYDRVYDLMEEYGDEFDLGEGWWLWDNDETETAHNVAKILKS